MLSVSGLRRLIERELETDRVTDDVTCRLLGSNGRVRCEAIVFAKQSGIFSGRAVCEAFPPGVEINCLLEDGAPLEIGTRVATLHGSAVDCLTAERTLLNLLSHLSGVATLTRQYVDAVGAGHTKILATRKTLPGLRDLQLSAVRSGGGHIHRRSLSDGILVKDNHLMFVAEAEVVARARALRSPLHRVEVEVQSLEQLDRLLVNPPDLVMLDNFSIDQMRTAISRINGRCEIEVSGGVSLERVAEIAALGVGYISVGRLTHSVPALDLSLDIRAVEE
jgi:nicotinate-nucleotide pyrophosphorylase (carboxylating)